MEKNEQAPETFLTIRDVCERLKISRATLYNRINGSDPTFPQPVRFMGRCTRFRESEVAAYMARSDRGEPHRVIQNERKNAA